jgi:ABC-type glucose/galactose transport system permease subunit
MVCLVETFRLATVFFSFGALYEASRSRGIDGDPKRVFQRLSRLNAAANCDLQMVR